MKKALFGFVVLTLVFATSCKKSSSSSNSWSFKGTTYNVATSSSIVGNTIEYISTSPAGDVSFTFGTTSTPTAGTYYVTGSGVPTATQVYVTLLNGTNTYNSTGGNGNNNQSVAVTVSSAGKVSVNGSGVELVNFTTPTDSSAASFSVTQP